MQNIGRLEGWGHFFTYFWDLLLTGSWVLGFRTLGLGFIAHGIKGLAYIDFGAQG